jgi:uncharacterized membrane protein YgcG
LTRLPVVSQITGISPHEDSMRHWRLPTVLLVLALFASGASATERILDFHSDIQILPDTTIEVHESIRLLGEGHAIQHGIYRDIPTTYKDRAGNAYRVAFEVVDVRRDGESTAYTQNESGNGIRIKIGSAATMLAPGEHTYEITYRAGREMGFFKDYDELYWNVTGEGWGFPMDQASATVTLPKPVAADKLRLAGYTGYQGSRDHNLTITRLSDTQIQFATTVPLLKGQGLTIAVGFPKGVVNEPTAAQLRAQFLEDNVTFGVALIGLAILLIYCFIVWMMVGREPRRGAIVVRYEPPPQMSPAAMCFLRHMGYNDRVFVSAAVDLAVKRYLTIEQEGSVYSLTKLRKEDGSLPVEEHNLMRVLFMNTNEIDLFASASPSVQLAVKTLKDDLKLEENQKLYQKNGSAVIVGIALSVLTLIAMVITLPTSKQGVAGFLTFWLSIWTFAVFGLITGTVRAWKAKSSTAIGITFGAIIFSAFEVGALAAFSFTVGIWAAVGLGLILATNAIFVHLLKRLTPAGRQLMDEVEGFRQFLTMVEGDRLQRSDAPARTPALFEKCLPYALALGVEQAWSQQFEGVLAQAANASGTGTTYSPAWFTGSDLAGFSAAQFATGFAGGFTSAVSSASSPPGSSSGSGGGGSSGGGGGGGGGGGW